MTDVRRVGTAAVWLRGWLAVLLAIAGCSSSGDEGASVFLPSPPGPQTPLVVLVPGGGWQTADPSGLIPLADDLAGRGAAVVTVTYRTAQDGAYFPLPAQDVACGLARAVAAVADLDVSRVVLAGHSAGAHLAALVALAPDQFAASDCPYPPVAPDALIGLSGPYDVDRIDPTTVDALFGARSDRAARDRANPTTHADERPGLPVLLVHGTADDLVPLSFTEEFAAALTAGGHAVTTAYPEGADHVSVFSREVAGPIIAGWLGLPTTATPSGP